MIYILYYYNTCLHIHVYMYKMKLNGAYAYFYILPLVYNILFMSIKYSLKA